MCKLLRPLQDLGRGSVHTRKDQEKRNQDGGRQIEDTDTDQDDGHTDQRGHGGKRQRAIRVLSGISDLPLRERLQRLKEFIGEAGLQILADGQLKPAEELRRRVQKLQIGIRHINAKGPRPAQHRQDRESANSEQREGEQGKDG